MGIFHSTVDNVFTVSVDGIIGVGKSTTLPLTAELLTNAGYKTLVVLEPVEEWTDMLTLFYEDKEKYGSALQSLILASRAAKINRAISECSYTPTIVLIDRSIEIGDRIFADLTPMLPAQREMYTKMSKHIQSVCAIKPNLKLFLDCPVDEAQKRVAKRKTHSVSDTYQSDLYRAHKTYFTENQSATTRTVSVSKTSIPNLECDITDIDKVVYMSPEEVAERLARIILSLYNL